MKKFLSSLSNLPPALRRAKGAYLPGFVIGDGLTRKLLNLFPLILPLCLIALIGGSSASAAVPIPLALAQQPPPCVLFGDFIEDGEIDVADIMQVANKWRCKCGDGCYESRYDIDNDCDIDIVDIMRIVVRWGDSCENPLPPIQVCGSISEDTTWTTGNVYLVTCDVTVNSGVTLTVQRGVVVKFNSGRRLAVNGSLLAQGTGDYEVVFTSIKDDTIGGDTNNDGTASTPNKGDWEAVHVSSSGQANLSYTTLRYGGNTSGSNDANLYLYDNASATLDHVTVADSQGHGVYLYASGSSTTTRLTVTASTVENNQSHGIYANRYSGTTQLTITNSTIRNNDGSGVSVNKANGITLTGNTFTGNTSYAAYLTFAAGTFNSLSNNSGSGNGKNGIALNGSFGQNTTLPVNPNFPFIIPGGLSINTGTTLTVPADSVVKLDGTMTGLSVQGTLLAQGTVANPVYFTSLKDDSVGGDTNNDGSATTPAPGDWEHVTIGSTGVTNMTYAILRYGGSHWSSPYDTIAMYQNASATLDHVTISNSGGSGIHLGTSTGDTTSLTMTASIVENNSSTGIVADSSSGGTIQLSITDSTIRNNDGSGISVNKANGITLTGNTFTGNTGNAVGLTFASGTFNTLSNNSGSGNGKNGIALYGSFGQNTTLPINPNFPFIIASSFSIHTGVTLTVPADSVVKLDGLMTTLSVQGTLLAQGTVADPVYFTSLKDDSVGGDTNNDGSATTPAPGDWYYVSIGSTGVTNMTYVILRYGGAHWSSPWNTLKLYQNASATLDHVTISNSGGTGIHLSTSTGYTTSLTMTASTVENNSSTGIVADSSTGGAIQLSITDSTIRNNNGSGVSVSGSGNVSVSGTNIYGNTQYGVTGSSSNIVIAENNWWGHESGPDPYGYGDGINYHSVYSPTLGVWVIDKFYVDADPWLGKDYWIEHHYGTDVPWNNYEAEPVNTATGNYTYQHTDLSIPTRSQPLEFTRSYNSRAPQDGPLGFGWTHNYNVSATENITDSTVLITYGDGRQDKFTRDGAAYVPNPGTFSELTKVGNAFILRLKDQTVYNFNASGKLASVVDRNGNTTTLGYTGDLLTSVTEPAGRVLLLTYNADDRLIQVQDSSGRTIGFSYDGDGNLSTVTDAVGFDTTYTYDADHRLLTATDANGHVFVTNVYDGAGRVVEQYDAQGNQTTFAYDEVNHKTLVTDPRGHTTTYQYDDQYRLLSEKDPLNFTVSYTYDDQNNRTSVTDKKDNTTTYAYDERGNTTVITDTLGYTTTMTYDAQNNLTSATDARSHTANYVYDANGNLTSTTDPLDNTTTFTYDGFGQMTLTTDANGNTMQYQYDTYGHQTAVIDALGNATIFTYDNVGRKLSETDPLGRATQYGYDAANRLTVITDTLGNTSVYTYDAVGNRIAMQDTLGLVTQYGYDAKDRLTVITDTLGNTTVYAYDANDNRTSVTDASGNTTTFTYDARNRLASMQNALGNTTTYQYDANGNRTQVADAKGQVTTYTYDTLNRLTQMVNPSFTVTYTYDAVGNRLTMTDPTGTTEYAYDALNRPTVITDTTGLALHYTYDAVGNRATLTYPDCQVITYTYDAMSRLIGATEPFDPAHQVTYTYDTAGQLSQVAYPNGVAGTHAYDALGRLTAITYTHAISGTLDFFQYTLDAVGHRTQAVDTNGTTSYTYDNLDRLTGVIYPDGEQVTYAYDAAGNRTAMTSTVSGAIAYTYDTANRLLSAGSTTATWDVNGNMLTKGSTTYTYDAANRLTQVVSGTTTVQYTYTGDGKRVQRTQGGSTTQYLWDTNSPLAVVLVEVTDGVTTTYLCGADLLAQYDAAGNPTYLLTDGQGNVRLLVDGNGNVVGSNDYDVFGAVRATSGSASTTYRNAGHAADDAVGLVYMRARWYDPTLGRFLTPDPRLPGAWNVQDWNRYVYERNNPMTYIDADGEFPFIIIGAPLAAYGLYKGFDALWDFATHMDRVAAAGQRYYDLPVSGDFNEQREREWRAAEQEYTQLWAETPAKMFRAATSFPGTTVSGPIVRPGIPTTGGQLEVTSKSF